MQGRSIASGKRDSDNTPYKAIALYHHTTSAKKQATQEAPTEEEPLKLCVKNVKHMQVKQY